MPVITERARAKVNLTLKVLGKRPDGYHEIESIVAFADAADVVTFDRSLPIGVSLGGPFGPSIAGENLVLVTLDLLSEAEPALQLGHVHLEKLLPVAAGVGGGSADAAAVLRAVRTANPDQSERVDWLGLAARLGADVPVCFLNSAAMMRGIGERLEPIAGLPPLSVVLVNPQAPVPADKTARVFRTLGAKLVEPSLSKQHHNPFDSRASLLALMTAAGNDLVRPALEVVPEIGIVMNALSRCNCVEYVAISGGGPTCFAVFPDNAGANAAAAQLLANHPNWWIVATTVS